MNSPTSTYAELWKGGPPPELADFLANGVELSEADRRELLLMDQSLRWRRGVARPVEAYVLSFPGLLADPELRFQLAVEEYGYREERGERPSLREFVQRFPDIAARLETELKERRTPSAAEFPVAGNVARSEAGPSPAPDPSAVTSARSGHAVDFSGEVVGDYDLLDILGRGGMGTVYRARHRSLGRVVALKMLNAGYRADREELRRFEREATAAASLDHPGIVPIHEVVATEGPAYYTMALVEGTSLAQAIAVNPLPPKEAAALLCAAARAVHYAHGKGIVHRDLTPANILIDKQGAPRITDFGLARIETGDAAQTETRHALGTPSYLPPEQATETSVTAGPAADIYTLGATLYHALTGRPPFRAATVWETLRQVQLVEPVPPRALNPAIPRDLETIVLKCLAKRPEQRYGSAGDLADDLQRFVDGRTILARRAGTIERAWRWCRRHPTAVAALVAAAALAGSLVGGAFYRQSLVARHEIDLIKADSEKKSLAELADERQYHVLVAQVQDHLQFRRPGWKEASWNLLHAIRRLPVGNQDLVQLRGVATECLLGFDLQELPAVGPGFGTFRACWSRDGKLLAAGVRDADDECTVRLFEAGDWHRWREIRFPAHLGDVVSTNRGSTPDGIRALEFTADDRKLVIGTRSGHIVLVDVVDSGSPPADWRAHDDSVLGLACTADGRWLLSWDALNIVRRWPLDGPRVAEKTLSPPPDVINHGQMRWSVVANGNRLMAVGAGRQYHVPVEWESPSEIAAAEFFGLPPGRLHRAVAHPRDETLFAATCTQGVVLCDAARHRHFRLLQDPEVEGGLHESEPSWLVFDPQGTVLASSGTDMKVKFWHVASGRKLLELIYPGTIPPHLAWSPQGDLLAVTGETQTWLYRVERPEIESTIGPFSLPVRACDWNPTGDRLAVLNEVMDDHRSLRFQELIVWKADENCAAVRVNESSGDYFPDEPHTVAWDRTGRTIAFHGQTRQRRWFDCETRAVHELPISELAEVGRFAFAPDADVLWFPFFDIAAERWEHPGHHVAGWSIPEQRRTALFSNWESDQRTGSATILSLDAGAKYVACAGRDGATRLLDAQTGALQHEYQEFDSLVSSVALSPDGKLVASGGQSGQIVVRELPGGRVAARRQAHADRVVALSFLNGGDLLLSASSDHSVCLWRLEREFVPVFTLHLKSASVGNWSLTRDARRLALVLNQETCARLWDLSKLRGRLDELRLDLPAW